MWRHYLTVETTEIFFFFALTKPQCDAHHSDTMLIFWYRFQPHCLAYTFVALVTVMPLLKQGFCAERCGFILNFKFCGSSAMFERWPTLPLGDSPVLICFSFFCGSFYRVCGKRIVSFANWCQMSHGVVAFFNMGWQGSKICWCLNSPWCGGIKD